MLILTGIQSCYYFNSKTLNAAQTYNVTQVSGTHSRSKSLFSLSLFILIYSPLIVFLCFTTSINTLISKSKTLYHRCNIVFNKALVFLIKKKLKKDLVWGFFLGKTALMEVEPQKNLLLIFVCNNKK